MPVLSAKRCCSRKLHRPSGEIFMSNAGELVMDRPRFRKKKFRDRLGVFVSSWQIILKFTVETERVDARYTASQALRWEVVVVGERGGQRARAEEALGARAM